MKYKLEKKEGKYFLFVKTWFLGRWKPLKDQETDEQYTYSNVTEFAEKTAIDWYNKIIIEI